MDNELFMKLYGAYQKELYLYLYSLCRNRHQAEDLLHETFLKALLALPDGHTNMRAWLYVVARNLYYNYYNRQKKQMTIEASDFEHAAMEVHISRREDLIQSDILEEVLHKEEKKQLLEAVSQLKGQKKEVILLQYFGDFSQKEIAAMLKITPGNVKVLSYRAKKELKEYLTKEEGR